MDMQLISTANTAVSAGQTGGSNQSVAAAGKSAAGLFSGVLLSVAGTGEGDAGDDTSTLGAELLAAMGLMPQSLQLLLNQLQADAGGEQTLLVKLIAAISNDPKLADTLLDDKDMQAWLQDASALLSLLAPDKMQQSVPGTFNNQTLSDLNGMSPQNGDVMKLQQTLLTLATMLEKKPNDPLLNSMTAELQKALAPYLKKLGADQQAGTGSATQPAVAATASESSNNLKLSGHQAQTKMTHVQQQDATGTVGSRLEQQTGTSITVPVKTISKLDMLTAKGSFAAAALAGGSEAQTNETKQASAEDTQDWLPGLPLHVAFKSQQTVESLKAPVPTLSASNFAEEMGQFFVKSMKVSLLANGASEATLSLQPQNLGNIDVRITMQNGQLMAHIVTQTAAAKEMLESQLPQLRMMLQNQGLQVEKLEVTQNNQANSSMFHDQQMSQQSFGREQSGGRAGSNSGKFRLEEAASVLDAVDSKEQMRMNGYGGTSSFVATA